MSELVDKLHYKLDSTTDEITLYSTLGEVNNKGLNVKVNGINAYAGYGTEADGEASRMNYKPPTEVAQKVLKQAGEPVLLNLLGYRNNEELLQALPATRVTKGSYVHFNNENAPTISGYDFVCAVPNCFIAEEDTTVKIYYIPQEVADRTRTNWVGAFVSASGDLSLQDFANTFVATNFGSLFAYSSIVKPPKLNTSNVTNINYMFFYCTNLQSVDLSSFDTSKVTNMIGLFGQCTNLQSVDLSSFDTSKVTSMSSMFINTLSLENVTGVLDLTSCINVDHMFLKSTIKGLHLKNVPRSLDFSACDSIEGEAYIIDNYID